MQGTVKLWKRSFGFIAQPKGRDLFVHFSAIIDDGEGYRRLYEGDVVEFDVATTERGLCATNVRVIEPAAEQLDEVTSHE